MERGSGKKNPKLDEEVKHETEGLERSGKEPHAEPYRQDESATDSPPAEEIEGDRPSSGHRVAGTGSSADRYSYTDHGEEGGASHPKPGDDESEGDEE